MRYGFFLASGLALASSGVAEAKMEYLVADASGTLTVAADGSVTDVDVGDGDRIGDSASEGLEAQIRTWRFEPVLEDGKPVPVKAFLKLSLVAAQEKGAGQATMTIRNVWFLDPPKRAGGEPVGASSQLQPPRFPDRALRAGAGAEVMLLLELGEGGAVSRVGTERVALLGAPQGKLAGKMARLMSEAAVQVATGWRIAGYEAGQHVRVPVTFNTVRAGWQRMHPFTIEPTPWVLAALSKDEDVADMAAGGQRPSRLELLTDLQPVPGLDGDG